MIKKHALGSVIAVRELRDVNSSRRVVIKIGKPRRTKVAEWICPYSLIGLGSREVQYAYGIDALQAIFMAFEGVRGTLEVSGKHLKWAGGEAGDIGLPRAIPGFFGVKFSRKLDRMIEKEVTRFSLAAEKRAKR